MRKNCILIISFQGAKEETSLTLKIYNWYITFVIRIKRTRKKSLGVRDLLEPMYDESCKHGSEGAWTWWQVPATRLPAFYGSMSFCLLGMVLFSVRIFTATLWMEWLCATSVAERSVSVCSIHRPGLLIDPVPTKVRLTLIWLKLWKERLNRASLEKAFWSKTIEHRFVRVR